jgi:hypothetical protein
VNLATFIDEPAHSGRLGAPEDVDLQAWETYIRSARNQMVDSWNEARVAYLALERVRGAFGLPFIAAGGEAGLQQVEDGALSQAQNQMFLETFAVTDFLAKAADDALAGTRQVGYDAQAKTLLIELLPTDTMKVAPVSGRPMLVSVEDGSVVPVSGTISLPPLVWAAIATVAALTAYFTTDQVCGAIKETAQQKTMQTIATQQAEMVKSGKATPEQAKVMTDAIYTGATALETAKGVAKKEESESGIQGTARTLMWVALGITVLVFAAKVVPPLLPRERALT